MATRTATRYISRRLLSTSSAENKAAENASVKEQFEKLNNMVEKLENENLSLRARLSTQKRFHKVQASRVTRDGSYVCGESIAIGVGAGIVTGLGVFCHGLWIRRGVN